MPTQTTLKPTRRRQKSLVERAKSLLCQEISFIHSAKFARMKMADVEWTGETLYRDEKSDLRSLGRAVPTHLSYLFRKPLLTLEAEHHLFQRMNYLRYIANRRRTQLNTDEPNARLIREIEKLIADSEVARTTLVESNLRLVASIARRFAKSYNDFEELLSEGNAILLYAIDKFDFSRGFRFSTYATHAIQRHFYRVIERKMRQNAREVDSLSEAIPETVAAPNIEDFTNTCPLNRTLLRQMAGQLDERELHIIEERFGLTNRASTDKTLKILAEEMGLSKERVRQLQNRAFEKLREFLVARGITMDAE